MSERTARAIFERYLDGMGRLDFDLLREVLHPDFVEDFPQSGERVKGREAHRAMLERYPGGLSTGMLDAESSGVAGDDERWVLTPGFTVLPLAAAGTFTGFFRSRYPDGSIWHVISIYQLRDGRIYRATTYFAPEFPPAEWRRDIVELVDRGSVRPPG
jgi:ketosteroid isomerase-like protein